MKLPISTAIFDDSLIRIMQKIHRSKRILDYCTHIYAGCWTDVHELRKHFSQKWPDWCFLPVSAASAIVDEYKGLDTRNLHHPAIIAALAAWRQTQGVYRFDDTLLPDLLETAIEGDLPEDLFYRLPEWCVYINLENAGLSKELHGAWVHLEFNMGNAAHELRILYDTAPNPRSPFDDLVPQPIIFTGGTIEDALKALDKSAYEQVLKQDIAFPVLSDEAIRFREEVKSWLKPVLSLVLYLCSTSDIKKDGVIARPQRPSQRAKSTPSAPLHWDVGTRIGAALKAAYSSEQQAEQQDEAEIGGLHRSPRPHVRRAHWHGFRTGPMKREDGIKIESTDRQYVLKWLPPLAVNASSDDMPVVIRKVM